MDNFSKKILLSAGIGLGVAVSGVSLYLLFKPEDETYLNKDNDRRKIGQSNQSVVMMKVPKQYVGAVIGRGGEQIKKIQFDTKTRINFDDSNKGSNNVDNNGLKEIRILLIKGTSENIAKAETAINEIIREQSSIVTKHFNIETTAVGGIIGRNGENIRSLCERSGAKIKVDSNRNSKAIMTSICITGTDEQIAEAALLIDKEISQNQSFSRNKFQNVNQKRVKNYKLLAIEDKSNDKSIDLDTFFAKLEPINQQLLEVFVSAVNSPDQFFVQMCSTGAQLDHLMEDTTDFYEIEDNRIAFKPLSIKVGDIVTVPYPFDEHWYRAKVLSIEEKPYSLDDSDVKVIYLDYGDDAVLKYKQICDLKDELLKRMPFQAIECSLSGVAPKDQNNWSEEAVLKFRELSYTALWKKVFAKVVDINLIDDKREKYVIELIDRQTSDSNDDDWDQSSNVKVINIGEELVHKNLAVLKVNE